MKQRGNRQPTKLHTELFNLRLVVLTRAPVRSTHEVHGSTQGDLYSTVDCSLSPATSDSQPKT